MTDDQWQAAWKLYQSCSSVPTEQIHSFLNVATPDLEVRNAVLALFDRTSNAQMLDRIGQKIGRYVLTGRLGEGGMGEVYAARDVELGRAVAVKLIAVTPVETSSPLDRFTHEARAASALNHPNIVTIYEVIHATSKVAIAMELVDGTAFRQLCGSPLPVDRLLHLGEQVARALAAAHARGIVHCDIKPENLMVRQDGLVKVLDFGLARDLASVTSRSILPAGTLRYMSPEQSRGKSPSAASDVFSLGIVFYELATGTHPFGNGSIFNALRDLNQKEPDAPSSLNSFLPPHLDGLILKMLAKEPSERPPASDVARMLVSRFQGEAAVVPRAIIPKSKRALEPDWGALPKKTRPEIAEPAPGKRMVVPWAAAAVMTIIAVIGWVIDTRPVEHPLARLSVDLGPEAMTGLNLTVAISPDGRRLVFPARRPDGKQLLATRLLDQAQITILPGTENGRDPFFSPDGQWIGFFAGIGQLKKISV